MLFAVQMASVRSKGRQSYCKLLEKSVPRIGFEPSHPSAASFWGKGGWVCPEKRSHIFLLSRVIHLARFFPFMFFTVV